MIKDSIADYFQSFNFATAHFLETGLDQVTTAAWGRRQVCAYWRPGEMVEKSRKNCYSPITALLHV